MKNCVYFLKFVLGSVNSQSLSLSLSISFLYSSLIRSTSINQIITISNDGGNLSNKITK